MASLFASRKGRIAVTVALVAAVGVGGVLAAVSNGAPGPGTPRPLGPIVVGSGWNPFSWNGSPPPIPVTENPFTFTCTGTCTLRVTDCYIVGDQFSVAEGSTTIGTTSFPINDGTGVFDADQCFASPGFSHGTFYLAAGAHTINLQVIGFPTGYTNGGAFLEVLDGQAADPWAVVPTLSGWGMAAMALLLAGAGLAFILRMRHA
jgi:hypothetical protein